MKVGALDSLGEGRERLFRRLTRLERARGDTLLTPEGPSPSWESRSCPRWEHELLGFPVSCHPPELLGEGVVWSRYAPSSELMRHLDKEVEVCGLIVCERLHPTERGPMKFLTLADWTGFVEVALFADTYRIYGHLTTRPLIAVRGRVDPFDNRQGFCLTAHTLRPSVACRARHSRATAGY